MRSKLPTTMVRVLLVAALVCAGALSGLGSADARSVDDISQEIQRLTEQSSALDAKIADLERQITEKGSQIRSLSNDVALLQHEIEQLQLQIENTQVKIDKTNAEIEKTTIEIRATEQRITAAKEQLGALIRLLADLDGTDPFSVLLANKNFSDLLDQVQYTTRIQGQTQQRLDEIQQLRSDLDIQKHNLDVQLDQAENLKAQLQGQQSAVGDKKAEKDELLEKTKGEEANYQSLLKDTEKLQKQVQGDINTLQDELANSAGISPPAIGSGVFMEPCGCVITQDFGLTDYAQGGAYGGAPHTGIDFAGPLGSPVFASADGVVAAKGSLGAAAYGNWIVLFHAQFNVYTLYGHLISVPAIGVGTVVKQGKVIANVGSTGYSSGPHVHLGVSLSDFKTIDKPYGSVPVGTWVNPAPYF